jgi:hypothetical protein
MLSGELRDSAPATAAKVYQGEPLNDMEQVLLGRVPAIVKQLLGNIPRLEPVLEILRSQGRRPNGVSVLPNANVPWERERSRWQSIWTFWRAKEWLPLNRV